MIKPFRLLFCRKQNLKKNILFIYLYVLLQCFIHIQTCHSFGFRVPIDVSGISKLKMQLMLVSAKFNCPIKKHAHFSNVSVFQLVLYGTFIKLFNKIFSFNTQNVIFTNTDYEQHCCETQYFHAAACCILHTVADAIY